MKRVIEYGASWCSQCKQQAKEFNKNPLKCPLHHVNIEDLEDDELDKLKIKNIPVTILWEEEDGAWEEIHRWKGFVKSEEVNKLC